MSDTKNYFDKFVIDQIQRAERIREDREKRLQNADGGRRREVVNKYRERLVNLIRYDRKK